MNNIITQKIKEVLKNRIFSVFSQKIYEMVNIAIENITSKDANTRYLALISNLQTSVRNIVKSTLVNLFETLDEEYKDSKDRLLYYYINKTKVKRTIITVVGEISFERTYYKDKNTGKCFFYIDSLLNLPKYDFYKIKNIYLLGDGASWIREGTKELRLNPANNVNFYLCEFHFKQAIHHLTTDKDQRKTLIQLVQKDTKKAFVDRINNIILDNPERQETLTKKLNYLSKNYAAIKRMLALDFGLLWKPYFSSYCFILCC